MQAVLRCNYSSVIMFQSIHPFYEDYFCSRRLCYPLVYQNAQIQQLCAFFCRFSFSSTQKSVPSHSHCVSKVLQLKLLNLLFLLDSGYLYTNETHCSFIYYTNVYI